MKTIFFLILIISVALVFDVLLAPFGSGIIPPLAIIAVCYWFWRFMFAQRLLLALGMGLLFDIIGFLSMGVHLLIFIIMACACELMKNFFSNNESRAVIALNIVTLMIMFQLLMPLVSFLNAFAAHFI